MTDKKAFFLKMTLLTSILISMLCLCGCRTRLTNNTNVTSTVNDEYGYLQESYDLRRDELGLSTAKKPFFMGLSTDDQSEEEYAYSDQDTMSDYDAEEWEEEDWEEEDEGDDESDTSTTTTTTTPSTTTRPGSTLISRPGTTTTTIPASIKVNLDANGGTLTTTTVYVKKDSTYGALPTPVRDKYDFKGWYTAKKKGSKVTDKTKVTKSKEHTLYARWKKQKVKKYTITLDANAHGDSTLVLSKTAVKVEENGTYPELPVPKRDGHYFDGWFTKASGGDQVKQDDSFTENKNKTLYAHWTEDWEKWWNEKYDELINDPNLNATVYIEGSDKFKVDLIKDFSKTADINSAQYIMVFDDTISGDAAADDARIREIDAQYPQGRSVIIVSSDAVKGGDNNMLVYKLGLLQNLYGKTADPAAAAGKLNSTYRNIYMTIGTAVPAETPDTPPDAAVTG